MLMQKKMQKKFRKEEEIVSIIEREETEQVIYN
jgi:hypothetical protein